MKMAPSTASAGDLHKDETFNKEERDFNTNSPNLEPPASTQPDITHSRTHSKSFSPSGKLRKRRSNKHQRSPLFLAHLTLDELSGTQGLARIGLVLGAFLDLKLPQLTPDIYHLLNTEGVPAQFFSFLTHPFEHPANKDSTVLTIAKRSYSLFSLLELNQTYVENLVETHIHLIMELIVKVVLAPPIPFVSEPTKPEDLRHNFYHIQAGVKHLLFKQPSWVRKWLLTTRLKSTEDGCPPLFGLLTHLHHPGVVPLISSVLFASVESVVSLATTLDGLAPFQFVETVWNRLWDTSAPFVPQLLELLLELVYEGGEIIESVQLLKFLGSSKYSSDVVSVLTSQCPIRCRGMVDWIVGLNERVIVPEGRVRALATLTMDILHSEITKVWSAIYFFGYDLHLKEKCSREEIWWNQTQLKLSFSFNHYHLNFISLVVNATKAAHLGEFGRQFQPQLIVLMLEWVINKQRCSIIHSLFLTMLDLLGSSLVDAPNPGSSLTCFYFLLFEYGILNKLDSSLWLNHDVDPDLSVTLNLGLLIIRAIYTGLKLRSNLNEGIGQLLSEVEINPELSFFHKDSRIIPFPLENFPSHLSFTISILSKQKSSLHSNSSPVNTVSPKNCVPLDLLTHEILSPLSDPPFIESHYTEDLLFSDAQLNGLGSPPTSPLSLSP